MDTIGIKLADGSFYPVFEDGKPGKKSIELTTVKDNQTTVHVDVYRSSTGTMEDAQFVDTLEITSLNPHLNGEPTLALDIKLDENGEISVSIRDSETGSSSEKQMNLVSASSVDTLPDVKNEDDTAVDVLEPPSLDDAVFAEPVSKAVSDEDFFDDLFNGKQDEKQEEQKPLFADEETPSFEDIVHSISGEEEDLVEDFVADNPYAVTEDEKKELDEDVLPPLEEDVLTEVSSADDTFVDYGTEEEIDVAVADDSMPTANDLAEFDFNLPALDSSVSDDETVVDETAPTADDLLDVSRSIEDDGVDIGSVLEEPVADFVEPVEESDDTSFTVDELPAIEDSYVPVVESEPEYVESVAELPEIVEEVAEDSSASSDEKFDFELPPLDEPAVTEVEAAEPTPFYSSDETSSDDTLADDNITIPEFGEVSSLLDPIVPPLDSEIATDDFVLPDYEVPKSIDDDEPFVLPDLGDLDDVVASKADVSFEIPDFADTLAASDDISSPVDDYSSSFGMASSNMFEDLYDKETLEGKSSLGYDETEKKAKFPMFICILCALICILCLFFLFVIPTKVNVLNGKKTQIASVKTDSVAASTGVKDNSAGSSAVSNKSEQSIVKEEDLLPPASSSSSSVAETASTETKKPSSKEEPVAVISLAKPVPAKEDQIVIASVPSQVVPETPAKNAKNLPDTKYKVVWGDTLWDIANAFYKNPWKYTDIAKYNNLKNPNFIATGEILLIPAE